MNLHFKQIVYNLNKYLFIFLTLKIVQGHQHPTEMCKAQSKILSWASLAPLNGI